MKNGNISQHENVDPEENTDYRSVIVDGSVKEMVNLKLNAIFRKGKV